MQNKSSKKGGVLFLTPYKTLTFFTIYSKIRIWYIKNGGTMKKIISYGEQEIDHLSKRDVKLGNFIDKKGFVERYRFDDLFSGLCYNIINQQLSMKAADKLYGKICAQVGEIAPEKMCSSEQLFNSGLSHSKADCIALCAEKFKNGELTAKKLKSMSDEDILKTLTQIKGIGAWTAEMTMIFCLERKDILSLSDYGIRKGLSILHDIDIKDVAAMQKFKELYSPYGTTASIYLWEISKGGEV